MFRGANLTVLKAFDVPMRGFAQPIGQNNPRALGTALRGFFLAIGGPASSIVHDLRQRNSELLGQKPEIQNGDVPLPSFDAADEGTVQPTNVGKLGLRPQIHVCEIATCECPPVAARGLGQ